MELIGVLLLIFAALCWLASQATQRQARRNRRTGSRLPAHFWRHLFTW